MRLIDADALKKKANMRGTCIRPLVTAFQMCVTVHDIDNEPTVDAEPVRHGRWMTFKEYAKKIGADPNGYVDTDIWFFCSECEQQMRFGNWAYCPNCGAKMDEVK